jgi:hypothetical protein
VQDFLIRSQLLYGPVAGLDLSRSKISCGDTSIRGFVPGGKRMDAGLSRKFRPAANPKDPAAQAVTDADPSERGRRAQSPRAPQGDALRNAETRHERSQAMPQLTAPVSSV